MRNFCSRFWKEGFCCKVLNGFATNYGMRSFSCELWTEKFLLQIVEWQLFVPNCGMKTFVWEVWNEKFFAMNCLMRNFCSRLWNAKFLQ